MPNRKVFFTICLAAVLMVPYPVGAQPVILGQFAPIPPLVNEVIIGLTSLNSQLALLTTQQLFIAPFGAASVFTNTQVSWPAQGITLNGGSQVTRNPAVPSEIWLTGVSSRIGLPLYRANVNANVLTVTSTSVILSQIPSPQHPASLDSDGSSAYMVTTDGHVLKVDASTGNTLFDRSGSTYFIATPEAVALGPDGLLYVLDSNSTTGRVVIFDTSGNLKGQFPLSQPAAFTDVGPMTISLTGQLYSLSTDSTGTLGIDTYDIHSGNFLGRVSGANTFSADQGFNPGGHPAMFVSGSYLYFTTGTGNDVWVFSTAFSGTPGAPNCHGTTVLSLAQQYGSLAKAVAALGFPSVDALQAAITNFCGN